MSTQKQGDFHAIKLEGVYIRGYDVFLVVSNSGRNVFPIEATFYMKQKNVYTISISSFEHNKSKEFFPIKLIGIIVLLGLVGKYFGFL
ncbi:SIS domain-containing protein [Virgibacillus dokdonensis]|uniref:SIS domain-containing protein n=1 Tax=Virgibacillus dokdonensis TaxID=302167 RepID=UPI0039DF8D87